MALLRPKDAARRLGVCVATLRKWEEDGNIKCVRSIGKHRRFLETDLQPIREQQQDTTKQQRIRRCVAYCRVSSPKQKDDLQRQKDAFGETHPEHEIISDIGSGLNWKRKNLLRLVESILQGDVQEVVVAHRDRLCRFAFEFIEWICQRSDTKLVVQNQQVHTSEQELADDLMAIVHVFSCRHHGIRRYKSGKNQAAPNSSTSTDPEDLDEGSKADIQHGSDSSQAGKGKSKRVSTEETGGDQSQRRQSKRPRNEEDSS